MHYLDSGEYVGSETRHRVFISTEGRWRIVLDQEQRPGVAKHPIHGCRAHKPSFLVCRSLLNSKLRIDSRGHPVLETMEQGH